ncbi:hypothetical protein CWB41_13840 [Methylovirgula ligni]|uniref:Uncharacterized protein n=1 Tax=Methylovirgula ligni TaxID=569860 RepID=A0A3D9YL71_9HYPH|nr:hypothetical protein [Methylovirgula ligni]QAY96675.1 hypothetical protein CWB41_13840 [Methylovirgula ligni]REF83284.1 hypothetical protein DES32_3200 [Methylovirgula ligni]
MTPEQAREFRRLHERAADAISETLAALAVEARRLGVPPATLATLITSHGFHIASAAIESFIESNGHTATPEHFTRLAKLYSEKGVSESVECVIASHVAAPSRH